MFVPGDLESRKQFFNDYLKLVRLGCRLTAKEQLSTARNDKRLKLMIELDFEFDWEIPEIGELLKTIVSVVQEKYQDNYGHKVNNMVKEK